MHELKPPVEVALRAEDDWLTLEVSGLVRPSTLPRTRHLQDRAAALGATIDRTVNGDEASLRLRIPSAAGADLSPQPY